MNQSMEEKKGDSAGNFQRVKVKRTERMELTLFAWEKEKIIENAKRVGGVNAAVFARETSLGHKFEDKGSKIRWLKLGQISTELINNQRAFIKSMKIFNSLKESGNDKLVNAKTDEILENFKLLIEQQVTVIKAIEELRKEIFS